MLSWVHTGYYNNNDAKHNDNGDIYNDIALRGNHHRVLIWIRIRWRQHNNDSNSNDWRLWNHRYDVHFTVLNEHLSKWNLEPQLMSG